MHNVWVAGDTLYLGAYNAGFRAFDISGELRGRSPGAGARDRRPRPSDPNGFVPNAPMTWGVVVKRRAGVRERLQQRAVSRADGAGAEQAARTRHEGQRRRRRRTGAQGARAHEAHGRTGSSSQRLWQRRAVAAAGPEVIAAAQAPPAPLRPSALRPLRPTTVYVVSEGNDKVQLLKFGPSGFTLDHSFTTGMMPTDPDGPHGVAVAPDGKHYFVSDRAWDAVRPDLEVRDRHRHAGGADGARALPGDGLGVARRVHRVRGELQPVRGEGAVVGVGGGDGGDAGDRQGDDVRHAARVAAQPGRPAALLGVHDGRSGGGDRYPDAQGVAALRGDEGEGEGRDGAPPAHAATARPSRRAHDMGGHGTEPPKPGDVACSPTWAQPSADGRRLVRGVQQEQRHRGHRRGRAGSCWVAGRRGTGCTTWP